MRHAGPLFWVAKGREKEVLKSCDIHMKKIMETVIEMDKAVQGVCNPVSYTHLTLPTKRIV